MCIRDRAAEEAGVDLTKVNGSGFNGKIVKDDVEKYVQSAETVAAASMPVESTNFKTVEERKPLRGLRKVVGQRMFESYSQVPTVMQSMKVDMTELIPVSYTHLDVYKRQVLHREIVM